MIAKILVFNLMDPFLEASLLVALPLQFYKHPENSLMLWKDYITH